MRGNGLDTSPAQFRERPARSGAASLAGHQDRSASPLDPPGGSAIEREEASGTTSLARAVLLVLLPFAAGYYLSYLYRSINALIAGDLVAELGLTAADLGLLTSVYFLLFAAVQLPCGVLLDRYGPRLIDSALLLVAAAGSLLFALADGVATLLVGRALIGLGVAVGLMAGLKAIVLWFPSERVALANGWYIMLGALGALSATGPAETVIQALGWRGLFTALAVASAAVALTILLVVPDRKAPAQAANLLMSYVPQEKLLIITDIFNDFGEPRPNDPPPGLVSPYYAALGERVRQLKLDVQKIAPSHGRGLVPADMLWKAVQGKVQAPLASR